MNLYCLKSVLFTVILLNTTVLASLNLKLSVTEPTGVNRDQWPVSSGIPLPVGLVIDENTLYMTGSSGASIPCQFRVLERWGKDKRFTIKK